MSMLYRNTFPNNIVNVKDESAGTRVTAQQVLPLHCPLVFIRAAQGNNKCEWVTGAQAYVKYGPQTFDKYEPYWRSEQVLLNEFMFANQGAYLKRIIPADAQYSTVVVEAHVSLNMDITQYQRDEDGRYIYDNDTGLPLPEVDEMNNPVTMKGTRIKYMLRAMTDTEIVAGISSLNVTTHTINNREVRVYPIQTCMYKSPCKLGDKAGFRLYIENDKQSTDLIEATSSLQWTFVPVTQPYNSNVAYTIKDKYDSASCQMVMRPNQIDPDTVRRVSPDDTLLRLYYYEDTKQELLPYNIHFYSENIEAIGDIIRQTEIMNPNLTTGYMVNIATMTDLDDIPYYTAELDTSDINSVRLSNLTDHYLRGGDDGDLSDEAFEIGVQNELNLLTDPELADRFHYKITHLYDIGYSLPTKYAMANFMSIQKQCKIIMAAQDVSRHLYNMDEAVSTAAAIRAKCAITPESELYGTDAMRATIYAQSGYLNDTSVGSIVPMTMWAAGRRSTYHNSFRINGSWSASPGNIVNIYREINFTPYSDTQKQLLWDGAANYIQYKDGTQMFMPSVRSIYKDTTSLLSDDEFTDACIYLMYISDGAWTEHVSRKLPFSVLAETITNEINTRAFNAFGSMYDVSAYVYLTEEDLANHDTLSIDLELRGDYPKRIWKTTIIARGRTEV